jgi:hypothetical protein
LILNLERTFHVKTLLRLLDASLPAAIGGFLDSWGYPRIAMVLVGISVGLALAILWRALQERVRWPPGRVVAIDEDAGVALCEFERDGRTMQRWFPIADLIRTGRASEGG